MLVQFVRDVMYNEMFGEGWNNVEDYIFTEAGTVAELCEDGWIQEENRPSWLYPEDSYTEANPL